MKLLLLALLAADSRTVEVFKDKGDFFVRVGANRGLRVGTELMILGDRIGDTDEYRSGGKASVLEVWETVARVSPDEDAKKLKELKFARLPGSASGSPAAPANAAVSGQRPLPSGPVASVTDGAPAAVLHGHAELGGIGHLLRFTVYNDSNANWTNCELRLPTNKHYRLGTLRGRDQEGVMITRFVQDGVEIDRPIDSIVVRCSEGQARFNL